MEEFSLALQSLYKELLESQDDSIFDDDYGYVLTQEDYEEMYEE